MAKATLTCAPTNTTVTTFKAWAGNATGISYYLGQAGFVQQSDGQQAPWSTIANAPTAYSSGFPTFVSNMAALGNWSNATAYVVGNIVTYTDGNVYYCVQAHTNQTPAPATTTYWVLYNYEIWKSNDGLTPYYIKIEYGSQANNNSPRIRITLGAGHDGNGNLTGNVTGQFDLNSAQNSASTFECDFFYGQNGSPFTATGSNFGCWMWRLWSFPCYFMIERSKDNSGNDTSAYVTMACGWYSGNVRQQTLLLSGSAPTGVLAQTINSIGMAESNSWVCANQSAISPVFPVLSYVGNPLLNLVVIKGADATEGALFTMTIYGATHTYMMSKNSTFSYAGGSSFAALCMRWE